jgi:hypothetical protein
MSAEQWYAYLSRWHAWFWWRYGSSAVACVDLERDPDDSYFIENVDPEGYVT